jgi:hypothetical protein
MKWKIIQPCSKPPTRYVNDLFNSFFPEDGMLEDSWKLIMILIHQQLESDETHKNLKPTPSMYMMDMIDGLSFSNHEAVLFTVFLY